MIRVPVPADGTMIAATGSPVFGYATPLRLTRLVAMAVDVALGERAPTDRRERSLRSALAGLLMGSYVVEVDGRVYLCPDDVVVCGSQVTLRFFLSATARRPSETFPAGS